MTARAWTVPVAPDAVACGPIWLSPDEMCELRVRGERVPMSIPRLRMLAHLVHAGGRIVGREELYERSGSRRRVTVGSRAVDVHIFYIRRALGDLGTHLIAVPGAGYRIDVVGLSQEV